MTLSSARKAKESAKHAAMTLVRRTQDRVFGLAIRMLWNPAGAEAAEQEILLKIVTHLGSFSEEKTP